MTIARARARSRSWPRPARSAAPAASPRRAEGAVEGRVQEAGTGRSLGAAQVLVDERVGAVTDTSGQYRVRAVRTGWHRVAARLIGFRGVVLDSVFVRAGATIRADFELTAERGRAGAARGHRADRRAARPARHEHRAEDHRRGPAGPAGELAGGGDRAERGSGRAELPRRPDRRGVVHPRRARRQEPARRRERRARPPHPARSAGRGVTGHQRVLRAVRPGAVRPGQRRHPRSRETPGRAAPPSRPTVRSAARWITDSIARRFGPAGRSPAASASSPPSTSPAGWTTTR